jgi:hypothetical protein
LAIQESARRSMPTGFTGRGLTLMEQARRVRREAEEAGPTVIKDPESCEIHHHYGDEGEEEPKEEGMSEWRQRGNRRVLRGF